LDKELDAKQLEEKIQDLAESMKGPDERASERRARVLARHGVKQNRLERLTDDILDIFEGLPVQSGVFGFALTEDEPQQFFLDKEAYIVTNPDTKEFEFKKDTRLGTAVIGRTSNRRHMAKLATRYLTEKLLDQQRLLESEFISMKLSKDDPDMLHIDADEELVFSESDAEFENVERLKKDAQTEIREPEVVERVITTNRTSVFAMLTWFLLGILATIATYNGSLELLNGWVQQLVALITQNF